MFGFIWDLTKDTSSSTGYRVKMLVDNPEITEADFHIFEASEDVYNMQFDPLYKFPLIGEYCFHIVFDKNGVVTELLNSRKGLCNAVYSFGSPRTIASELPAPMPTPMARPASRPRPRQMRTASNVSPISKTLDWTPKKRPPLQKCAYQSRPPVPCRLPLAQYQSPGRRG